METETEVSPDYTSLLWSSPAPENVLSANRRRRLLFPTPEEETQAQEEV